jgi:hypothetical protein
MVSCGVKIFGRKTKVYKVDGALSEHATAICSLKKLLVIANHKVVQFQVVVNISSLVN